MVHFHARQIEGQIVSESPFNPYSKDAQFATIIEKLKNQDKDSLLFRTSQMEYNARIEALIMLQNGRVRTLERDKWLQRGFVTAISLLATAAWQLWVSRK